MASDKKWIYKVVTVDLGGQRVTYEYEADQVLMINNVDGDFIIRMKNGAEYAFNRRFLLTWRYVEA